MWSRNCSCTLQKIEHQAWNWTASLGSFSYFSAHLGTNSPPNLGEFWIILVPLSRITVHLNTFWDQSFFSNLSRLQVQFLDNQDFWAKKLKSAISTLQSWDMTQLWWWMENHTEFGHRPFDAGGVRAYSSFSYNWVQRRHFSTKRYVQHIKN